ncbi:MAG: hypothetical protein ABTQ34_01660 [Bdellovibrionales bacterium]
MYPKIIFSAVLVLSLVGAPQLASAEDAASPQDEFALSHLSGVSAETLNNISGGHTIVTNESSANVKSEVSQNSIGSIGSTGEVFGNSLSNNSGFTTLIANSGNQVSISQSTSILVYMH